MTSPITNQELAEWERLAAEATEGPWAFELTGEKSNEWSLGLIDPPRSGRVELGNDDVVDEFVCESSHGNYADAAFIAAARSAVPRLIERVRELEKNEAARDLLEKLDDDE